MKFLQLKEALDNALPPEPAKPPPPPELPCIPFYNPGAKKQTVVGGELILKPVDRTARAVVSKAPWWAKPPDVPSPEQPKPLVPEKVQHQIKPRKERMNNPKVQQATHPAQPAHGTIVSEPKSNDVLNAELATEAVKRTEKTLESLHRLVDEAKDARAALDILCDYWKPEWMDFMDQQDKRLKDLRMARMAFEVETKVLMSGLRDVRKFFLEENHDAEVAKLKEFVDLCERLQKLQQSGFLNTVADTILKLT